MKSFSHYLIALGLLFSIRALLAEVIVITSESEFNNKVVNSGKPAVVKFGTKWCGPCKQAEKPFHQLADESPGIIFATVDAEENKEIADKYNVRSYPTFKYFNSEGKVIETKTGFTDSFKSDTRTILSRMKPTGAQAMPEKKSVSEPEVVMPATEAAASAPEAAPLEEGLTCPAQGESVFEQAYEKIRDFFVSIGNTIRSWFR